MPQVIQLLIFSILLHMSEVEPSSNWLYDSAPKAYPWHISSV